MGRTYSRPWISDRSAWGAYAAGVAGMLAVVYVAVRWDGYGDIPEQRRWHNAMTGLLVGSAGLALTGPLAATFGRHWARPMGGKPTPSGLEDL